MAWNAGPQGASTEALAGQQLQEFQSLIMLLADLDLALLHPAIGVPPNTPLGALVLCDPDRLRKGSRWKAEALSTRDIIPCFAKMTLALQELGGVA